MSFSSNNQCPVGISVPIPGSILALLSASVLKTATGVVTNVSVAPSSSWYFSLSPFESIMLGLIVLKVKELHIAFNVAIKRSSSVVAFELFFRLSSPVVIYIDQVINVKLES